VSEKEVKWWKIKKVGEGTHSMMMAREREREGEGEECGTQI